MKANFSGLARSRENSRLTRVSSGPHPASHDMRTTWTRARDAGRFSIFLSLVSPRSVDRGDDEDDEDQVQEKDLVGQGRGGGPLEHFGPLFDLLTCFIYLSKKMSGLRL